MFNGVGIFPAIDMAFNFGLILTALLALGLSDYDKAPAKKR